MHDAELQGLHSTQRTSYDSMKMADAQLFQCFVLNSDHIPYCDLGKICLIQRPLTRPLTCWTGCSVAAAKDIHRDDLPILCIDETSLADQDSPPPRLFFTPDRAVIPC